KNKLTFFLLGALAGSLIAASAGLTARWALNHPAEFKGKIKACLKWRSVLKFHWPASSNQIVEDFSQPLTAENRKSFGKNNQLTFELYREGTFTIDGKSGFAWEKSAHYGDVALIRSTKALPKNYRISAVV